MGGGGGFFWFVFLFFLCVCLFVFFMAALQHVAVPRQGLNPSRSCNSTGSFNPLPKMKLTPGSNPAVPAPAVGFLTRWAMAGTPST